MTDAPRADAAATAPAAQPLVSVVIPVYNAGATLRAAIQSILAQTYPNWRLTLHDNCSTDNSRDIARDYTADSRVTLVEHKTHVPIWQNWNRCVAASEGDFYQQVGADDGLHPDYLSEKIKLATDPANAGITLFSSNRALVDKNDKHLFALGFDKQAGVYSLRDVMRRTHKTINPIGDPIVGLVRHSALRPAPYTANHTYLLDMELWLHALENGDMLHLPRALSFFRVSHASLSRTRAWRNYLDSLRFYRWRCKPFYRAHPLKYYAGYATLTARSLAREAVFLLRG